MEFSLILPTRKRVGLLFSMLNSIEANTINFNIIETLVIHDNDDIETGEALSKHKREWIKVLSRDRGENLSRDYFTWAIPYTSGNYLWALNDDAEICTYGWDEIVINKMKDHEVAIGNVACPHYDLPDEVSPFCYFPIVTRKAVEKLGYFLPEECPGWGADSKMCEIFSLAGKMIDIQEVKMKHINGKKLEDDCFHAMELRSLRGFMDDLADPKDVHKEVAKLGLAR